MLVLKEDLKNNFLQRLSKSETVSSLTMFLINDSFYTQLLDTIDHSGEEDYSSFNDLEMIYLYVHQQKDLNKKKNRAENTKKEYIRDLLLFYKQLLEHASIFEISIEEVSNYQLFKKINHRHIRKYQEWIKDAPLGKKNKPYSVATLNRKMVIIKGLFRFLFDTKYIDIALHQKMKSSNVRSYDRPDKDLSSVEVMQLIDYFRDHPILYGLISVLATTGVRIAELCTARVCDLTYIEGEYWLTVMGKGKKPREVLIFPNVLEAIKIFRSRRRLDLKIDRSDTSPLFTTAKGKAYSFKYLSNYITNKIKTADLDFVKMRKEPISPHFFRHAWAIISSEQGVSLQDISQGLGHADIKTTMIYLKRKMARKNNAAHAWKGSDILNRI
ncbi:integrase (plasmid) [Bacillus sp. S3]|nr:integrase [Bacillus sp. S3]